MSDNDFPKGIFFNKRHDNAPDFIRGSIGFNVVEACRWLQENADHDGRVKLDIKVSKGGKTYLAKNDFVPNRQAQPTSPPPPMGDFDDSLPF